MATGDVQMSQAVIPPYHFPDEVWIGYDSTPSAVSRDDLARSVLFFDEESAALWGKRDSQHRYIRPVLIRPSGSIYQVVNVPATHKLKVVG